MSETSARPVMNAATVERLISIAVALGSGLVLAIAIYLEPSEVGHGTHTQLGLGQCSFLTYSGLPCPMCGATTSFALMAALRPITAIINQPFASLLFGMTVGAFAISSAEAIQPKRRWTRILDRIEPVEHWLAGAFLVLMGLSWLWKIALMEEWITLV